MSSQRAFVNAILVSVAITLIASPPPTQAQGPVDPSVVQTALAGVPYGASYQLNCTAPCTYTNSPVKLPDGTDLKVVPDSKGYPSLSFTPTQSTADFTVTISGLGKDNKTVSINVTFKIRDMLIANPTGSAATGTRTSPVLLPSLATNSRYAISIGIAGGNGCSLIEGSSPKLPPGLFQYVVAPSPGKPNFTVNTRPGVPPADYTVSLDCGAPNVAFFKLTVTDEAPPTTPQTGYDSPCKYQFNDCDWIYNAYGGVEQSALSAQDSATNAFIDLFVRAPWNLRSGNVWLRSRFLGAPSHSDTFNVSSAITDPTGTLKSDSISKVGTAVDYTIGYQYDFFKPSRNRPDSGMFTLGLIAGFGATTPTSSQSAAIAYTMPDYGSQECNQLQIRFGAGNKNAISVPLPAGGTLTDTSTTPSTTKAYCSLQTVGLNNTPLSKPIPINDIAFVPQDRTSFLLKWGAGLRLVNRWHTGDSNHCSLRAATDPGDSTGNPKTINGPCTRSIVDFTLGQDQVITGGVWRKFVLKGDAILPIPKTGAYFFGSANVRTARNTALDPLLLTPVPIQAAGAAAGAVTVPSPGVWLLPMRQPNRDFYRFGLSLDLSAIVPKLFTK